MSERLSPFNWQGRDDQEDGELRQRWHHMANANNAAPGLAVVGFASDLGVSVNKGRVGASEGPYAIRRALCNQAWHSKWGLTDAGTICVQKDLADGQRRYAESVAEQLNNQYLVIGIGGGHEIAWGSYQGLINSRHVQQHTRIGILNFDAHFDLRKPAPRASSGTPFRQIAQHCEAHSSPFNYCCLGIAETANTAALFDYAHLTNTRYLLDYQCSEEKATALLDRFLPDVDELYVTICLDAFPAHVAPGVSAPSGLGIGVEFVIKILKWLATMQKVHQFNWRMADIAEMNPQFDIDQRTAKLAARLMFEVVQAVSGEHPRR